MVAAGKAAGFYSEQQAIAAIDWNTLGLLLGMMLIVNITGRSGVFQYIAIWSAKTVNASASASSLNSGWPRPVAPTT